MDARFIGHKKKIDLVVEMSYPWTENREKKQEEKPTKYVWPPLLGYDIWQYNILDVLGGWSREENEAIEEERFFSGCREPSSSTP